MASALVVSSSYIGVLAAFELSPAIITACESCHRCTITCRLTCHRCPLTIGDTNDPVRPCV